MSGDRKRSECSQDEAASCGRITGERDHMRAFMLAEADLLTRLVGGEDTKMLLSDLCQLVEADIPGSVSSVLFVADQETALGSGIGPSLPPELLDLLDGLPIGECSGSCGTAAYRREPVYVVDTSTDPLWAPFREVAERFNISACWSAPFFATDGCLLGTFAISHGQVSAPGKDQRALHATAAALAGLIVEHRQSSRLQQSYRDKLLILDTWMQRLVLSATQPQQIYQLACEGIAALVQADLAIMPMLNDTADSFTYLGAFGSKAEMVRGQTMGIEQGGLCGWVAMQDRSVLVPDLRNDERVIPELAETLEVTTGVLAPLRRGGKVVGALSAYRGGLPFTVMDQQILMLFAQQVSVALDNANLFARLEEQKERAEVTLRSLGEAVIATGATGVIEFMNPAAEQLTGWSANEATGQALRDVVTLLGEDDRHVIEDPVMDCLCVGEVITSTEHTVLVSLAEQEAAVEYTAAPMLSAAGDIVGVVMVMRDVSKERKLKSQLSWQASHDAMTGLVNRREFENRLARAISSSHDDGAEHALLYMDLDQFKVVNDSCGHVAGDELLKQLAVLFEEHIRKSDTLARLGGDEFGVLLEKCSVQQAAQIAEMLRKTVREYRFAWERHSFDVGVSIGLVPILDGNQGVADVLSAADVACYQAKELGRNRVHMYEDSDVDLAMRHGEIRWVSRISKAIDENRLQLYRQPIVPVVADEQVAPHYELLVRLLDEDGNIVPPGAFIPAAERYNIMSRVDCWVIEAALSGFPVDQGDAAPFYSINLSGASINETDVLAFIKDRIAYYNVPPGKLCFEITETAAIANLSRATEFINELRALGCKFALDDFGSGLSSFAYLKMLSVDFLKVDGMFVKDLVDDPIDYAMVRSINEIGHVMGMQTIAEFVENDAILVRLRQIGVDFAQGFGIASPEPMPYTANSKRGGAAA